VGYSLSHRFILLRFIASYFLALHLPLQGSVSGPSRNALDAGEAKGVKFMGKQLETNTHDDLISSSVPFVQALARRLATSMPHSIEIGDLVQDGMIGLIDAANRFDEKRGIKFETFAERRVRGSMLDALRKGAWPRGIRRMRRELEAARECLRDKLDTEPSLSDLANHMGVDESQLSRVIIRINTIESTSPLATAETVDEQNLPPVLVPSGPPAPDKMCETVEVQRRVRAAIAALPHRERKVITLYYFGDATMKTIGEEMNVNESRVSQLHARAVQRLRKLLGPDLAPEQFSAALTKGTSVNPAKVKPAQALAVGGRTNTAELGGRHTLKAVLSNGEERLVAAG